MEQSYKEKYEDILARLERAKNDNDVCDERFCCVINEIIPELAESEDEKVRKELIKHLKELSDWKEDEVIPVKNPSYYRQWASWLEKQEEHANFLSKIQVGDKVTRNEDGVLVNLSQLKRVAKPREKQCEQKFEMKTAEESLGIDSDTYNKIIDECIYGDDKVEPKFKVGDKIYLKPEYRMPDDDTPIANTVKEIKRIDDKHYRFDGSYIFVEDQDKYELVEQKPAEWSEEDEQHIDSLLKRLDALCRNKFERTRFAISEDRDWLKSLRPQNRWKPSDEQMGCLSDAIEHYNSLGYPASKLKELLDDLKKIKGEV